MSFADATACAPAPGGGYDVAVAAGWDIGGNAKGGYLLALATRAMAAAAGRPDPVTVTAHYLAPAAPGPALVETELVKVGKRFATVRALLRAAPADGAEGRPLLALLPRA